MRGLTWLAMMGGLMMGMAGSSLRAAENPTVPQVIYSCKDAQGRTLTSDLPIPECQSRATREFNRDGQLRREVVPLTPEQVRQREAEDETRRQADLRKRDQAQRDRLLLLSYSSIDAIEAARQRAVDAVQSEIAAASKRLDIQQKSLVSAEAQAAPRGPRPPALKARIDAYLQSIAYEREFINLRKEELARIHDRFDADIERFRILSPASARP